MTKTFLFIPCLMAALCCTDESFATTFFPISINRTVQINRTIPQVKGTVIDQNGESVIGATVIVKGTSNGVLTDLDGNYVLSNVTQGATIEISYVGYITKSLVVNGVSMGATTLREDYKNLEELVVIGYDVQRKADLTGSVANVDASKLNAQSNATIGQALQGKIAGVDIVSQGGYPGGGTLIMNRGIGTFNNATPLYIVDGMYMSSIDHINPSDIETIDVLKDASSSAIYGSRAANGVVIVTTKNGSNTDGVPVVNTTASIGINAPSKYLDLLNASEWAQVTTESRAAAGLPVLDMAKGLDQREDNDWQDIMFSPAVMQNYNLSVSGGGKYTKYYNSFCYTNQEGTMKNTCFKRYTMQSKLDFQKSLVNVGTNVILTYDENRPMLSDIRGGMVGQTLLSVPTLARYDHNNVGGYGGTEGDVLNLRNPLGMADNDLYRYRMNNTKIYANIYVRIEPVKGLKYKLNFTPDFGFYRSNVYLGLSDFGLQKNTITSNQETQTRTRNLLLENLLTYEHAFGKHKISALAGFSFQDNCYRYLWGAGQYLPEGLRELDAATSGLTTSGNSWHSTLNSILGRVFYSYDNRYLIQATIRRDGSSKFGPGHHWGNFPSVSIGWNLGEEKFFKKNAKWIDLLKIRTGYGKLGNQEIDNYMYSAVVSSGINYPNVSNGVYTGAFPKNFSNPGIKWESTSMTNIGIDFLAFNSRLSLTLDYYVKNTKDILLEVPIPLSTGSASNPIRNAGKIRNRGCEFNISWNDQIDKGWTYSASFNGSFSKNKVVSMGTDSQYITGGTIHGGTWITKTIAGYPIAGFWLIPTNGYFNSEAEVKAYNKNKVLIQPSAEPGDIRFEDVNNDGTINDDDRVFCGSPFPKFTYAFNGRMAYKCFDLGFTIQGVVGNKIYNATRQELENVTYGSNYLSTVLDHWSESNHNAKTPRLVWNDPNQNARTESNRFLESGTYLRLRTLQLGYNFPDNLLGFFKKARVYLEFDNLFTITSYSGYSPDVNDNSVYQRGFDEFIYPSNRTYVFGINLTF